MKFELIARQSSRPRGLLGEIVAFLMAFDTARTNRVALEDLQVEPTDAILDVGCGHGRTLSRVAARARDGFVAGLDPSEVMLRHARLRNWRSIRRACMSLMHGESSRIPYPDGRFDKAFAVHVLSRQLPRVRWRGFAAALAGDQASRCSDAGSADGPGEPRDPIGGTVRDVAPVQLRGVESEDDRLPWRELVGRFHYLGHKVPFGAHLRYLIEVSRPSPQVVGCLQVSSPAWKMAKREQWIGWAPPVRERNLQQIVNSSRFLLLPWVKVSNLASTVLARMVQVDGEDTWEVDGEDTWEVQNCPAVYDELDRRGFIPDMGIVSRPGNTVIVPGRELEVAECLKALGVAFKSDSTRAIAR